LRKALIIDLAKTSSKVVDFDLGEKLVALSAILAGGFAEKQRRDFLIFGRGVLAGHAGIGLATATITGYSPQSGGVVEAKVEGALAKALLGVNLEAIVLMGKAQNLIGISIEVENDKLNVAFNSAKDLAGLDVWKTTDAVLKQHGEHSTVAAISEHGESQSLAASVVVDHGFATSCGGLGGQAGSLNLKYLVLPKATEISNETINKVTADYLSGLKDNPLTLSEYQEGFSLWIQPQLAGYQAGNNFGTELPQAVNEFKATEIRAKQVDFGDKACPGCGQSCLKAYSTNDENPINGGRSHQLSIAAFVSQYGDSDSTRSVQFNQECHRLGLEHLYTCQLLIDKNIDKSIPINTALNEIASQDLTNKSDLIKGIVIPPWDPRGSQGLGLAMALNPSGPRYDVIEHDIDFDPTWAWERHTEFGTEFGVPKTGIPLGTLGSERTHSLKQLWKLWSGIDAVGVCMYASPPTRELRLSGILAMLESVLGEPISKEDFYEAGRLRLALQREANYQLGLKDTGEDMPEKFFSQAITAQVNSLAGAKIDRSEYRAARDELLEEFDWSLDGSIKKNSALAKKAQSLRENVLLEIR
jgi:aldehyde:ferredoxin oxidoreductase